jgi:hypothetical protein
MPSITSANPCSIRTISPTLRAPMPS